MFNKLISGAVVITLLALAGCGDGGTRIGTITKKEFDPAHNESYLIPIPHTQCYSTGKSTSCSTYYTYIPSTRYVPDHWDFKLELCSEGDAVKEKKCKHGEVSVDESIFHQYKEGDFYGN